MLLGAHAALSRRVPGCGYCVPSGEYRVAVAAGAGVRSPLTARRGAVPPPCSRLLVPLVMAVFIGRYSRSETVSYRCVVRRGARQR